MQTTPSLCATGGSTTGRNQSRVPRLRWQEKEKTGVAGPIAVKFA